MKRKIKTLSVFYQISEYLSIVLSSLPQWVAKRHEGVKNNTVRCFSPSVTESQREKGDRNAVDEVSFVNLPLVGVTFYSSLRSFS